MPHNLLLIGEEETESEPELAFSVCIMLLYVSFSVKLEGNSLRTGFSSILFSQLSSVPTGNLRKQI